MGSMQGFAMEAKVVQAIYTFTYLSIHLGSQSTGESVSKLLRVEFFY